jgi:hypothetical protein
MPTHPDTIALLTAERMHLAGDGLAGDSLALRSATAQGDDSPVMKSERRQRPRSAP